MLKTPLKIKLNILNHPNDDIFSFFFLFSNCKHHFGDESKIFITFYNLTEEYENVIFIEIYLRLILLEFLK